MKQKSKKWVLREICTALKNKKQKDEETVRNRKSETHRETERDRET